MAASSNPLPRYREFVETEVARKRIGDLLKVARAFYPEPPQEVFVSEYREADGRQVIRSVWMFSDSFVMEFKDPLQAENFDIATFRKSLVWLDAEKKDFDFRKSQDSSRLTIKFKLATGIVGDLFATGKNCGELLRITRERLLPNMIRQIPGLITEEQQLSEL